MNNTSKTLILLNPAAHSDRARSLQDKIAALSVGATLRVTDAPGQAGAWAHQAQAEGFDTVVAAGGDGTVNEVVNGLADSGLRFGILPVGTMNVFATELGIPANNLAEAWRIVEDGHTRAVDLPMANGARFVQLAGAGLDAAVVERTSIDSKRTLGPLSYLLTLAQVAAGPAPRLQVEPAEGVVREGSFVLVGNGRFYGGPFVLFKDARLDDGLLDVLVFQNQSHWDLLRYVQAIAFGQHAGLPDVEYFQTPQLRVTSAEDVPVEVDGELTGRLPYEFGFSDQKLTVLAPVPTKE